MAEFRVYNGHVACDCMQGLTRSARRTDGPTQQLSVYACVCIQTSCLLEHYLFIYLFAAEVDVENSSFNLII